MTSIVADSPFTETCSACFGSIRHVRLGHAPAWVDTEDAPLCEYSDTGLHVPVAEIRPLHIVLQEYMDTVLATGVSV